MYFAVDSNYNIIIIIVYDIWGTLYVEKYGNFDGVILSTSRDI